MKRLKLIVALVFATLLLGSVPLVNAAPADDACSSLKLVDPTAKCGSSEAAQKEAEGQVSNLVKVIINTLSMIVGAVSVVMIIIGGFRYVISGGDSNGVSGAKNTILYAVVGLVIVLFAQVIVRFVYSSATAVPKEEPTPTKPKAPEKTTWLVPTTGYNA